MELLHISIALNIYLIVGVLLYSLNKSIASQSRAVMQRKPGFHWLYLCAVILLWPLNGLIRYAVQEKIITKYFY